MEKVVYILGAGFSAYAGLPLMSNFYIKSKDMYFENIERYKYFQTLFNNIDKMAKIKNYYKADLFNIEEILSIMEMQQNIGETGRLKKEFIKYIVDVVEFYSPKKDSLCNFDRPSGDWYKYVFGNDKIINEYGNFILSLLNAKLSTAYNDNYRNIYFSQSTLSTEYSIITLNYDLIIENYLSFILKEMSHENYHELPIYKLHGCISKGNIIPPTWAKSISNDLVDNWKSAFSELVSATKIRIIGYSLPISDSYIRYFLKSAVIRNERLKEIDIICYDPTNKIEQNYNDFIVFDKKRFQNKKTEQYLDFSQGSIPYRSNELQKLVYTYNFFERHHDNFMLS